MSVRAAIEMLSRAPTRAKPQQHRVGQPRLLLIGPTPPPYHGVAVAMRGLVEARWRDEFSISHLDLADRRGIEHVNQPDLRDVILFTGQWLRLLGLVIRKRPHVVYVPISQSTLGFLRDSLLIWPSYLVGSRIVLHLHGGNFRTWFEGRSAVVKTCVRAVLRRAARVVVLGESLRALFDGLVPAERVAVVPNGIEWPARGAAHAPESPRQRVLHLGTLAHYKGMAVMLEAIALVVAVRPDVEFVLAGPWGGAKDRSDAEKFVAAHGLQGAISFVGMVEGESKRRLYESASLFVFPGIQQEGQPLVVIEAMAAGIPVLFTNRGCLRDTVIENEQGLEVRAGDAHDLAEKILWMLTHPLEMRRMGMSARRRFEAMFTQQQFIENMHRVFACVIAEAPQLRA